MAQENNTIQVYTTADKISFAFNGLGCLVALGSISAYADPVVMGYHLQPILFTAGLVSSCLVNIRDRVASDVKILKTFPESSTEELPSGSKDLPNIVAELSEKFGLPTPPLYITDDTERRKRLKDLNKRKLDGKFGDQLHASTLGAYFYGMLISKELLKVLKTKKEVIAVVAHELGHRKAGHTKISRDLTLISEATDKIGTANYLMTLGNTASGIASFAVGHLAKGGTKCLMSIWYGIPYKDIKHFPELETKANWIKDGTIIASSVVIGRPEIILAWGAAKATSAISKAFLANEDRHRELQADRLGADVTNDPGAMCDALQSSEKYEKAFMKANGITGKNSWPDKIQRIFCSHPTLEDRCRNLKKMMQNANKPAECHA